MHDTEIRKTDETVIEGKLFEKWRGPGSLGSMVIALLLVLSPLAVLFFRKNRMEDILCILLMIAVCFLLCLLLFKDHSAVYRLSKDAVVIDSVQKALYRNAKWEEIRSVHTVVALSHGFRPQKEAGYLCLITDESMCLYTRLHIDGLQPKDRLYRWVKDPYCIVLPHTEQIERFIQDRMDELQREKEPRDKLLKISESTDSDW